MALHGKSGKLTLGANKVGERISWNLDMSADMADKTSDDSANGWKEFLAGLKGATGSADCFFKNDDTNGQVALINAFIAGTELAGKFYVNATVNFAAQILVSGITASSSIGDLTKISFKFQITGAVTPTLS